MGKLYVWDGTQYNFECYTLEDTLRNEKISKITAIPAGIHPIKPRFEGKIYERYVERFDWHAKLGMIHIILDTFKFVMIHIGNYTKDTEGCPLVGTTYKLGLNGEFIVEQSTIAYKALLERIWERLRQGTQEIEIINLPHLKIY